MRTRAVVSTCIAALFASRCGGYMTSPTAATAVVSTQMTLAAVADQSVVGAWRGFVRSRAVRAGSESAVGFSLNCAQRWEISSQSGHHFEGQMSSEGNGADSDWRCLQTRSFTGDVTADDQVTISFSPSFTPGGCTDVTGGQRASGSMSRDSIVVDVPYRATCDMLRGGGAPPLDLDIAATITLTPW